MKYGNPKPVWPPVPLPTNLEKKTKSAFLRHTKNFVRQFCPTHISSRNDIRHLLNKAKPTDQNTFVSGITTHGTEPRFSPSLFIPEDASLTTYDIETSQAQLHDMKLDVSSMICIHPKPELHTDVGSLRSSEIFQMDNTVCSDLINSWSEDQRVLLAHVLSLNYIQFDGAMLYMFNKGKSEEEQVESKDYFDDDFDDDDDIDEELEQYAMAGDEYDDEDGEYDPTPQEYYEYFLIQDFFQKVIDGKL